MADVYRHVRSRKQDTVSIRTLNAIHLAVCRAYRAYPLFTMDAVMVKAAQFLRIPTETV